MSEVTKFPNGILLTATEGVAHLGCLEYCLRSNTAETDTTQVSVGYQLFCADGTPITDEESVRPLGLDNTFCVDFTKDIIPFFKMTLPNCVDAGVFEAVGSTKDVYLEHWDIIYNNVSCETTTSERIKTLDITVLNLYRQFYETLDLSNVQFLTTRPSRYVMCKDGCDFLYIWNPTGADFSFISNSSTNGIQSHVAPAGLSWIPVGAGNFIDGALDVGDFGNLQIIDGNFRQSFRFNVEACCCPNPDMNELIFMETTGAFAGKRLCLESQRIITSNEEICNIQNWNSVSDRRTEGGKSLVNATHYEELTWSDKIDYTKENERWIKNFHACPVKYMRWVDYTGVSRLIKILMPSSSFEINRRNEQIEISITGYIFKNYEAPCC